MRRVLLVGGGHAHVQVLEALAMRPWRDVEVLCVVDRAVAAYSGMLPAVVAGELEPETLQIDVAPLCARAGVGFVEARVLGFEPEARRVQVEGRGGLDYDLLSVNLGSRSLGVDVAGVRDHALATRPLDVFLARLDAKLPALAQLGRPPKVVVVGGGAAGVELAFCVEARLRGRVGAAEVCLVDASEQLLRGFPAMAQKVLAASAARGIALRLGSRVASVRQDAVLLDSGDALDADLVMWATGAAAPPELAGLPLDERGFVRVRSTLEVVGLDGVFAVGDCAALEDAPWVPRAGVYAVRQGPILTRNLRWRLDGGALEDWRPQRDVLRMLNLGDGTAVVGKWGVAAHGAWVHRWKHRIDADFMDRFQVLDADGRPRMLPARMGMDDAMRCGGCAAKVGPDALASVLGELGLTDAEDAAWVPIGQGGVVASVDAFPAFTQDAWLVGRVMARHGAADVLVKGVAAEAALALVQVPERQPRAFRELMLGLKAGLDAEGVRLVGGHSSLGPLAVGLAVFGGAASLRWPLAGRVGDRLVLVGALGTGIVWRAHALGLAKGAWIAAAITEMTRPLAALVAALQEVEVRGATDVSGFGLAGHTRNLARAAGVAARLRIGAAPRLPGVDALGALGVESTAAPGLRAMSGVRAEPGCALAFDPQTAGPLLLAVPPDAVARVFEAAAGLGWPAAEVGELLEGEGVEVRHG